MSTFRFPSVKAALGDYAAHRKGPKMRGAKYGERVQRGHVPPYAWLAIGSVLAGPEPVGLGLTPHQIETMLRWATRADDASEDVSGRMVAMVAEKLRDRDLLVVRKKPRPVVECSFVDLESGEVVVTRRLV